MSDEERRTQRMVALNSVLAALQETQRDLAYLLVEHPRARRLKDATAHVLRARRLLLAYKSQITVEQQKHEEEAI